MTTQHVDGVHAHTHPADLASETGKQPVSERKSAGPWARARAVPHLHLVDQSPAPDPVPDDAVPETGLGSALLDEMEAVRLAAEASDWAREPMTPVTAAKQIAPAKGEAGRNWIVWTAMTVAGLARFILVSLGYLVARGGETRIRAGVVTGVLVAAIVISALVGHSA
jgi:hypothetical protein